EVRGEVHDARPLLDVAGGEHADALETHVPGRRRLRRIGHERRDGPQGLVPLTGPAALRRDQLAVTGHDVSSDRRAADVDADDAVAVHVAASARTGSEPSAGSGKWQATVGESPSSPNSCTGGAVAQISWANGHRVRKRHPEGGSAALGSSPSTSRRSRSSCWSTVGTASMSTRV